MRERKRKVDELAEIKDPEKVKVLILAEQRTAFKDFFFIRNFTEVIKIDLSYNKLTSFPNGFTFRHFKTLKILHLQYNKFSHIKAIAPLTEVRPSL